ncbi:hypothetical protein SORBI_3010G077250 [Sorghum bicolor]|uniref:Uncharacterized protein n=1 Tax=Sorghum bicolor TaxID=4558 RepID=A0A1W0VRV9_SORBI|nr:hypothetical protein SORBI_3010G077250 [Sorghum bicolor]
MYTFFLASKIQTENTYASQLPPPAGVRAREARPGARVPLLLYTFSSWPCCGLACCGFIMFVTMHRACINVGIHSAYICRINPAPYM